LIFPGSFHKSTAFNEDNMTSEASVRAMNQLEGASIQEHVNSAIEELLGSFPNPKQLSADQRRGMIARYTAVLEGNFIYWMTGTYLSVKSEEARSKILDNLREEVRDCHPGMMRRFAMAANAVPTDSDALDVYRDLTNVRLFVGRLSGVRSVLMMAFFEGFIQRFMSYLAELAALQGSVEQEYTDVHGVCDVTHTQELFRALAAEMALNPLEPSTDLFEGVGLLRTLIQRIVQVAGPKSDIAGCARLTPNLLT
jgi:Iron-containing redox enzyme